MIVATLAVTPPKAGAQGEDHLTPIRCEAELSCIGLLVPTHPTDAWWIIKPFPNNMCSVAGYITLLKEATAFRE